MDEPSRPFRVNRQGAAGLTADQVRGSRFQAPFRGVRAPADWTDDLRSRSIALAAASSPEAFLCGASAAAVLGLPIPYRMNTDRPSLAMPARTTHLHRHGVEGRRLDVVPAEVMSLDAVRLTTPARTVLDLARDLSIPDIVAAADAAVRLWGVTDDDFLRALNRRLRYSGKVRARDALPLVDARSESPQESRARAIIAVHSLPVPTPQVSVLCSKGRFIGRVDLGYPECRLALEYQGAHHWTVDEYRRDAERRTSMRAEGWTVLEIVPQHLRPPYSLLSTLSTALTQLDAWPLVGHRILREPRQGARHRPW